MCICTFTFNPLPPPSPLHLPYNFTWCDSRVKLFSVPVHLHNICKQLCSSPNTCTIYYGLLINTYSNRIWWGANTKLKITRIHTYLRIHLHLQVSARTILFCSCHVQHMNIEWTSFQSRSYTYWRLQASWKATLASYQLLSLSKD